MAVPAAGPVVVFGPSMASAAVSGILCGCMHVVGPDHLGTLMTLSALMQPFRAFKVGAAWGLGHSTGMVVISAVFVSLHGLFHEKIALEAWEHYGNYVIGASMVCCGLFFMLSEQRFLEEQPDGTFKAKGCGCTTRQCTAAGYNHKGKKSTSQKSRIGKKGAKLILGPNSDLEDCEDTPLLEDADDESDGAEAEDAPKPPKPFRPSRGLDLKGLLIGVLQGLCCPMGLVGMSFIMTMHVASIIMFLLCFIVISVLGTGLVTAAWAYLSSTGTGSWLSPKVVYQASCAFTLTLGISWITANYFGMLEMMDYTEGKHSDSLVRPRG